MVMVHNEIKVYSLAKLENPDQSNSLVRQYSIVWLVFSLVLDEHVDLEKTFSTK